MPRNAASRPEVVPVTETGADALSRYLVDAADAALSVLQIVAARPDLRLIDIAAEAALNTSRVLRLLATLEHRGFVIRDGDGRYRLGLQTLMVGRHAEEQIDLVRLVQPYLDRLRDETTESTQCRIRSGLSTVCIAKADTPHSMRVHTEVGRSQPLHVGSSKLILALGEPELLGEMIAAGLTKFTDRTLVDRDALAADLEVIRKRGYSISRSERIDGALSLGAPMFGGDGMLVGTIALLGPESRMKESLRAYARLLVETAAAVSRDLGAVGARPIALRG